MALPCPWPLYTKKYFFYACVCVFFFLQKLFLQKLFPSFFSPPLFCAFLGDILVSVPRARLGNFAFGFFSGADFLKSSNRPLASGQLLCGTFGFFKIQQPSTGEWTAVDHLTAFDLALAQLCTIETAARSLLHPLWLSVLRIFSWFLGGATPHFFKHRIREGGREDEETENL